MQEGMWEEVESVTGQRSNQLNYVPSVFSYCFWKPSCLPTFLTFNRSIVSPASLISPHRTKFRA
jgi:hypothetical protein